MPRSRSKSTPPSLTELVIAIFPIAAVLLIAGFKANPLLVSAIFGLVVSGFVLTFLWLWQRRRIRRAELAMVGCQV